MRTFERLTRGFETYPRDADESAVVGYFIREDIAREVLSMAHLKCELTERIVFTVVAEKPLHADGMSLPVGFADVFIGSSIVNVLIEAKGIDASVADAVRQLSFYGDTNEGKEAVMALAIPRHLSDIERSIIDAAGIINLEDLACEAIGQQRSHRFGVLSIRDLIDLSIKRIEAGKQETGVRTGYTELDKAIGGFRRGNVTILGGKPSFGKTSWTIALTNAACDDGEPVLVIGAEDVARMYGDRFLALRAKLNATAIRDLDLNDTEKAEAYRALGSAPTVPTFLPARGKTSREVAKAIREIVSETGAKLVVVDFLQRIRSARRAQDRRNEVTMVCEEITDAIKESDAAGLVISAFKRTEHPRPELEDLKESGDLEYMAEHILLGWKRETRTTGKDRADVERVLLVAKNKDGVDPAYLDEIVMPFDRITGAFRKVPAGARYTRETPPEEADIWDGLDNQSRAAGDYQEDHGL